MSGPGERRLIQLVGFHCERCEYEWVPRNIEEPPRVCPKCKSPYWDRPRKTREKYEEFMVGDDKLHVNVSSGEWQTVRVEYGEVVEL